MVEYSDGFDQIALLRLFEMRYYLRFLLFTSLLKFIEAVLSNDCSVFLKDYDFSKTIQMVFVRFSLRVSFQNREVGNRNLRVLKLRFTE